MSQEIEKVLDLSEQEPTPDDIDMGIPSLGEVTPAELLGKFAEVMLRRGYHQRKTFVEELVKVFGYTDLFSFVSDHRERVLDVAATAIVKLIEKQMPGRPDWEEKLITWLDEKGMFRQGQE